MSVDFIKDLIENRDKQFLVILAELGMLIVFIYFALFNKEETKIYPVKIMKENPSKTTFE